MFILLQMFSQHEQVGKLGDYYAFRPIARELNCLMDYTIILTDFYSAEVSHIVHVLGPHQVNRIY